MIKNWMHSKLNQMQTQYQYNVDYMRHILDTSLGAFVKFSLFQVMSSHARGVPADVYFAARIRAALVDDCGPCIQLVVDMALESGVAHQVVAAIVAGDTESLEKEVALVVSFTDYVLAHDPMADDLREQVKQQWGDEGLITLSYAIATTRVYPGLKYAMGYGQTCHRVTVGDNTFIPQVNAPTQANLVTAGE